MAQTYDSLIPSIEARESGWIQVKERLSLAPKRISRPTITLSREFGCEGYPLAERLRQLLEQSSSETWAIFDKALLQKVAADEKLSMQLLSHLGDESHAMDVLKNYFGYLTHSDAYAKLVKHLVPIARAGNAIIVGRGGAVVCRDLKNCFHIRIEGSFAFRAANMAHRLDLPLAEAEDMIHTQAKLREKFVSECLQTDITASRWYDAVFNNERQSVETIAQACLKLIMGGWPDKTYFKSLP